MILTHLNPLARLAPGGCLAVTEGGQQRKSAGPLVSISLLTGVPAPELKKLSPAQTAFPISLSRCFFLYQKQKPTQFLH